MSDTIIEYAYITDSEEHYGTWTGNAAEAVNAAADFLGAEETSDGYTYTAEETGETYRVSSADMETLGAAVLGGHGQEAYSLWCATSDAVAA